MKDLTKANGTYVQILMANRDLLDTIYSDHAVTFQSYKNKVLELAGAANKTPAQRRFVLNVESTHSKESLCQIVYQAIFCGMGLGVNKKANSYQ